MSYQPIENYGIIGDLNTVALVGLNGSIDFMCFPNFDSPSIFAALLDDTKGGFFKITPKLKEAKTKQLYLPDTNVLLTRFLSVEGVSEITDFMPVEALYDGKEIVRRMTTIRGEITYEMQCRPRFNYGRSTHTAEQVTPHEVILKSLGEDGTILRLMSSEKLNIVDNDVVAHFTLAASRTADFLLEAVDSEHPAERDFCTFITQSLFDNVKYWQDWINLSNYQGKWSEMVNRSALMLKLLTSCNHGSVVAAPTFSLPESIGGKRNWDYRYTWIRDASFTMDTFIRLGYKKEAIDFMRWMEKVLESTEEAGLLGIMYSIRGNKLAEEEILEHLEGYQQSKPVRIGNNAYGQLQLDIYGELMDAVYLFNEFVEPVSYDFWLTISKQIDWLCSNWNQPDEGIWEVRGGKQNFLYSRVLCWAAFDRGIRISESRSFPLNPEWKHQRDEIYKHVYTDFWNDEKQAFMQYPGSSTVDASSLLMPLLRFISPTDPKWLSTLALIETELVSDSLVYRYNTKTAAYDGFDSHEGTFSMCSFWYVECLARAGQVDKARFYFEKMLGYANHLGLYAEQLGFHGEHLGNFPQAFTHLGLISAAVTLNQKLTTSTKITF